MSTGGGCPRAGGAHACEIGAVQRLELFQTPERRYAGKAWWRRSGPHVHDRRDAEGERLLQGLDLKERTDVHVRVNQPRKQRPAITGHGVRTWRYQDVVSAAHRLDAAVPHDDVLAFGNAFAIEHPHVANNEWRPIDLCSEDQVHAPESENRRRHSAPHVHVTRTHVAPDYSCQRRTLQARSLEPGAWEPGALECYGFFHVSHVRTICPATFCGSALGIGSNFCTRPAKQSARYRFPN